MLISVPMLGMIGMKNAETSYGRPLALASPFISLGAYFAYFAMKRLFVYAGALRGDHRDSGGASPENVASRMGLADGSTEKSSAVKRGYRFSLVALLVGIAFIGVIIELCKFRGFLEGFFLVTGPVLWVLSFWVFF
ncbi:MAG TPA: hypothetical protein VGJ26_13585, partial [Pirellulales bacterium]